MLVQATQLGYFNDRRVYPGERFKLKDEKQFSERWMKVAKAAAPVEDEEEVEAFEEEVPKKNRKTGKLKKHPTEVFAKEPSDEEEVI